MGGGGGEERGDRGDCVGRAITRTEEQTRGGRAREGVGDLPDKVYSALLHELQTAHAKAAPHFFLRGTCSFLGLFVSICLFVCFGVFGAGSKRYMYGMKAENEGGALNPGS